MMGIDLHANLGSMSIFLGRKHLYSAISDELYNEMICNFKIMLALSIQDVDKFEEIESVLDTLIEDSETYGRAIIIDLLKNEGFIITED